MFNDKLRARGRYTVASITDVASGGKTIALTSVAPHKTPPEVHFSDATGDDMSFHVEDAIEDSFTVGDVFQVALIPVKG